ncbi:hypothetical protein MP228_012305 [Amoeboaphelidium protococcarum]|nr:hypothetical protein MP228_012305 [Amoeboaphelidium protococcarum]
MLRLYNMMGSGIVHPDEYVQSLEPLYKQLCPSPQINYELAWEYSSSNPARSLIGWWALFYPVRSIFCQWNRITTMRMVMFLLSILNDYLLFVYILGSIQIQVRRRLYLWYVFSLSSLLLSTKTFSNTLEQLLLTLLIALQQTVSGGQQNKQGFANIRLFTIAFLIVFGTFIRISFPIFAAVPILQYIVIPLFSSKLSHLTIVMKLLAMINGALLGLMVCVSFDSVYYSASNHVVFTPLNNILYNSSHDNLSLHGIHPRYLHLLNLVILFGPLAVTFIECLIGAFRYGHQRTWQPYLSLACCVLPLLVLSLIPHQEMRFLQPLSTPIVVFCAQYNLSSFSSGRSSLIKVSRYLKTALVIVSIIGSMVMAHYHQAGIISCMHHLSQSSSVSSIGSCFAFYKTYPPLHSVYYASLNDSSQAPKSGNTTQIHHLSGYSWEQVMEYLNDEQHRQCKLIAPSFYYLEKSIQNGQTGRLSLRLEGVCSQQTHLSLDDIPILIESVRESQKEFSQPFHLNIYSFDD